MSDKYPAQFNEGLLSYKYNSLSLKFQELLEDNVNQCIYFRFKLQY